MTPLLGEVSSMKGFTLIEVLVVLFALALTIGGAYVVIHFVAKFW